MNEAKEVQQSPKRAVGKVLAVMGAIAIAAFLAGFIPMWFSARTTREQLQESKARVARDEISISLGSAAIHARHGDYEIARQQTSRFFTALREETGRAAESVFSSAERERVAPLFAQRDKLITLLARGDPASADRLSDLYLGYQKAVQGSGSGVAPTTNGSESSKT